MTLVKLRGRSRSDKVFVTFAEAVADIPDGSMVIIGHFGGLAGCQCSCCGHSGTTGLGT